jgi:hypothetical protein
MARTTNIPPIPKLTGDRLARFVNDGERLHIIGRDGKLVEILGEEPEITRRRAGERKRTRPGEPPSTS